MKVTILLSALAAASRPQARPVSLEQLDRLDSRDEGFHIDPSLPDGNYRITLSDEPSSTPHIVKRWEPLQRRWQALEKRGTGTNQYTFLVDEADGQVKEVALDVHAKTSLPIPVTLSECIPFRRYEGQNRTLIQDDYYASKQAFFNWCEMFPIVQGHIEMALNGNVAVWACQRRYKMLHRNWCSEAEYEEAERYMNQSCQGGPAWVYMGPWKKEYGRGWKGDHACRNWAKFVTNADGANMNFEAGHRDVSDEPRAGFWGK